MERNRLVAAVIRVLLEEIANRNALEQPAEIPAWLTQGLAQQLLREPPYDLVAGLPEEGDLGIRSRMTIDKWTNTPPLAWAHAVLQTRPPLTLDELSWPEEGQEEEDAYRSSAQLFVTDLLQLDGGRPCLRAMISELPRHYNWQMSFLDAFQSRFTSRLELEKWWALCVVRFTGRDLSQAWSSDVTWKKLDALIRTGAQMRTDKDDLPLHEAVTLQTILAEWNLATQEAVLKDKIQRLAALRNSASQDLVHLVDDYRQVLTDYIRQRDKAGQFRKTNVQLTLGHDKLAQETIRRLDTLDSIRADLRARSPAPQEAKTSNVGH